MKLTKLSELFSFFMVILSHFKSFQVIFGHLSQFRRLYINDISVNYAEMFELIEMTELPGDQPELRKCMMPLIQNYQSKIAGHGLELKRIAERLLIRKETALKC